MTGKTHMAAGIAASFAVAFPDTPKEMVICLSAGAVGAVISDIDVSTSEARRNFNKLLIVIAFFLSLTGFLEYYFQFGIWNIAREHGYVLTAVGFTISCRLSLWERAAT